ncbi:MAG: arylsulfatase A-like enzyme [Planctomycetota bacterium]
MFIAVDDLRPELGCYGVREALTPNIDRLAASGVLFTRHYVQVPTCGASRYALLTGRSPAHSGVRRGNDAFYRGASALHAEQQIGAQSLPESFRRNGYRTIGIGKISHTPDGRVYAYDGSGDGRDELPNAWDALPTPFGPWQRGWGSFFAYAGGRHREDGGGHQDLMEFVAERDEDLPDGLIAAEAVDQLRQLAEADQPFFLGVGFYKPHLPFVATRRDKDALAKVDIAGPTEVNKPASSYWHGSGEFYRYDAAFPKTKPLAEADRIETRRAYLACVHFVDRQVGKVLDALEETGLAESTIVVLWGDHGWHLGDSAIWGKHSPHERALHSPLIIRQPGVGIPGTRCDAVVETIDVYPTLLDLAQATQRETAHALDGHSLRGLMLDPAGTNEQMAISYWGKSTSVRSSTHRLITTGAPGSFEKTELYALEAGPDPTIDIADQHPELARTLLRAIPRPEKPMSTSTDNK